MPSTSRRLAVLCAVVAALIVGRPASAQAASNDFVLSYAASHLQPGMHFEFTVLADFGTLGSEARRGVYPDSVTAHEPAAQALRWRFTVPAGGTVAAKSFRFAFPHPIVASRGSKRLLFLTIDCRFDGFDQQRRPAVVHTRRTLAIHVGPDGPDPGKRCLQLAGQPNGDFGTVLQSSCNGGASWPPPSINSERGRKR